MDWLYNLLDRFYAWCAKKWYKSPPIEIDFAITQYRRVQPEVQQKLYVYYDVDCDFLYDSPILLGKRAQKQLNIIYIGIL